MAPAKIINTPGTKPIDAVTQLARELEQVALSHGYQIATFYGSTTWDDHNNFRCLDTMISRVSGATVVATGKPVTPAQEKELGFLIADYVWVHRDRLRLNWQIWRGRIRRRVSSNRVLKPIGFWAPYFKPTTHFDHPHTEIAPGPYVPPTTRPGAAGGSKVPSTRDVFLDRLEPGQKDSDSVWRIQDALQKLGYDVDRTRDYDQQTVAAVKAYQTKLGDDAADGDLGPLQTAKLFTHAGIKVNIEARS